MGVKEKPRKETALVVGFNTRPIVASAKRAGFTVLAADYWGDIDLANSADDVEAVLRQTAGKRPREELDKPTCELLVKCAEILSERHHRKVDLVLVGSGLDDRPDLWKRLAEIATIVGNSTETLKTVRNRLLLYDIASNLRIFSPFTLKASSLEESLDSADRIGYPVVLKPPAGGGGLGIRLASSGSELKSIYLNEVKPRSGSIVFVQEYVRGEHVSASIMGDGKKSIVVSVNEQLIGLRELGARAPFIWCGNIVPLQMPLHGKAAKAISSAAKALGDELRLVGSNGFDFVFRHKDNTPVVIECNPRFQGTLECVEMATGANLVSEHVKACRGKMSTVFPEPVKYVTKMIVFAKCESTVGDLTGIQGVGDVSPSGVVLDEGDPICTVHRAGKTKKESEENAKESVAAVYRSLSHHDVTARARRLGEKRVRIGEK